MKKLYFSILLVFLTFSVAQTQNLQLSPYSEVSIYTLGPGDALFERFGHNAIRVKDPVLRLDIVYNYGTFDFNDPNFYTDFAKGRLLYWLSILKFDRFIQFYKQQKRWAKEQLLDLTHKEKQEFFDFLQNNAKRENASYLYDPYYDNCSTKLRDITRIILKDKVSFSTDYADQELTLRQIMNNELPWNTWGSLGINVALGSKLDQKMTADEYMYLPDYLYLAYRDAKKIENGVAKPLIKQEIEVLRFDERPMKSTWSDPFYVFLFVFLVLSFLTYRDIKRNKRTKAIDFLLFLITGAVGCFIVFLWFFTNHRTAPNNFNILWAFAPNLILAFISLKKSLPKWVSRYIKICLVLLLILFVLWIFKVQVFALSLIPVLAMLIFRYAYLSGLLTSKK